MKSYESLIIIKPNLAEADVNALIESIQGWISGSQGVVTLSKPWGIKELAYPIEKFTQGYYYQVQFDGTRVTLSELRARIVVTENILRDLTVTAESITSKNPVQPEVVAVSE